MAPTEYRADVPPGHGHVALRSHRCEHACAVTRDDLRPGKEESPVAHVLLSSPLARRRSEWISEKQWSLGAGPAGLAAAAELRRRGILALVLEQGDAVGASWRTRYDRLRLNSSRWMSRLPGARYAAGTGVFPPRDEVVRYLEGYATSHALDVRCKTSVERIDRDGDGMAPAHLDGRHRPASNVIVATGYAHTPVIPAGLAARRSPASYCTRPSTAIPCPFRGADMLVVGSGLLGHGDRVRARHRGRRRACGWRCGRRPTSSLRSAVGPVIGRLAIKLGTSRADLIMCVAQRLTVGDLSPYGLPVPEEGMASRLARLGVAPAIIDKSTGPGDQGPPHRGRRRSRAARRRRASNWRTARASSRTP